MDKILIIEDEALIRDELAAGFRSEMPSLQSVYGQ